MKPWRRDCEKSCLLKVDEMTTTKKPKIDLSPDAVTAHLKRACGLGDAERFMTIIRSLLAEIHGEKEIPELPVLTAQNEGRVPK